MYHHIQNGRSTPLQQKKPIADIAWPAAAAAAITLPPEDSRVHFATVCLEARRSNYTDVALRLSVCSATKSCFCPALSLLSMQQQHSSPYVLSCHPAT